MSSKLSEDRLMAQLLANHNPCTFHPFTPSTSRTRLILPHRSLKVFVPVHRRELLIRIMQPSSANSTQPSTPNIEATNSGPVQSSGPIIPLPSIPVWARWVLGSIACVAIPFYKKILRIEDAVEKKAEQVFETIEKVAEVTEKVAADVAEALPAESKLKQEALEIEHIAEVADKDAEQAEAITHKVDEVKEKVETVMDPIVEEGELTEKEIEEEKAQEKKAASPSTNSPKAS